MSLMTDLTEVANKLMVENEQLKATIHELTIDRARIERHYKILESKLPEPCVKRLNEAFKTSTDNAGLKQAINCELRGLEKVR
jgi:hypothetical protein